MQNTQYAILQRRIPAQDTIILYYKDMVELAKLSTQKC